MYNYNNMNYIPNNSNYNTEMYPNYNWNKTITGQNLPNNNYNYTKSETYASNQKYATNGIYTNNQNYNINPNLNVQGTSNNELINKLNKEAGNNMNFNKPNYIQNVNPNDLYEVYTGFIRGNMFKDLYNSYKISKPYEVKPINKQAEMLTYIYAYSFATHDLNLYLDTHPNDTNMLNLFKTFTKELDKITKDYEREYGPIYVNSTERTPWSWNESPWPWENE